MTKTITSEKAGTLTQHEKFEDWWEGKPLLIPFLDMELPVTFMDFQPEEDKAYLTETDEALTHFLELDGMYRLKIAQPIFENFVEYCSYISEDDIPEKMKGSQPLSIWNFVYPTGLFVSRRTRNDKDIYLILSCECDWEQEHGLQLVFRQGKKLTRVSDQDGHLTKADAYDLPDSEDELLRDF